MPGPLSPDCLTRIVVTPDGDFAGFVWGIESGDVLTGHITLEIVQLAVLSLPLILGALWVGIGLRRRFDVETYRGVLRVALWVIAVAVLIDAGRRLVFDIPA